MHRAGWVAGRSPDAREPLVQQPQPDAVASSVEAADGRLEIGRCARHPADREGRFRRALLEIDEIGAGLGPAARGRHRRWVLGERQRQLESGQLIGRSVTSGGRRRGLDGRSPGRCGVERREPVGRDGRRRPTETRRERGVIARPRDRQEIPGDGLADRSVAEPDRVVALDQEAVGEGFRATGPQVRVEDAGTETWARDRSRRGPAGVQLESGSHRGELVGAEWAFREGQQPQHPPAFLRADGHPRDHELLERARE